MNNDELNRLGQNVIEEMKKIKISLPLFELLKVTEIKETFLNNLKDKNLQGFHTQSAMAHTQVSPIARRP